MDRNMILIADDQEINREILKAMFEEQYGILQAASFSTSIGSSKST